VLPQTMGGSLSGHHGPVAQLGDGLLRQTRKPDEMTLRSRAVTAYQWLALDAASDPRDRARELRLSWERLLGDGGLTEERPTRASVRRPILDSWRRSLETGLDPDLLAPLGFDVVEIRERWSEHPLGALAYVLDEQLQAIADESRSLIAVSDAGGLLLHIQGADHLKERAAEMNFVEGARYSEEAAGTNGIGTALAADHALQVFASEHFSERHRAWSCSAAPIHDPASGEVLGVVALSTPLDTAHPAELALTSMAARTIEQELAQARQDVNARLRRRYGDIVTGSTDLLVRHDGEILIANGSVSPPPLTIPEGGGEIILGDGSIASAEPLGRGGSYLIHRSGRPSRSNSSPVAALERAEVRARELAREQAALRQVATLVARESSPAQLFAVVAEQVAHVLDAPLVRLVRYEHEGSRVELVGGWGASLDPLTVGAHWLLDGPGVLATVRRTGRPARVDDYSDLAGEAAAVVRKAGMRASIASPIVVAGRLWGAIAVLSPRSDPFPQNTEARLADFTELVATAVANAHSRAELARSEQRAHKLAEEHDALRRVATLVAHEASADEVFAVVAEEIGRVVNVPAVALLRYLDGGAAVEMLNIWSRDPMPIPDGTRLRLDGPDHVAAVWKTQRSARLDDTDVPGEIAAAMRAAGLYSGAASPVIVGGRLWGAVGVGSGERLPDDIEARLDEFTELVATAMANSEARDQVRDLLAEQSSLRQVATLVARGASPDEVFAAVAREVAGLFGAPVISMVRFEPDGSTIQVGAWGEENPFPVGARFDRHPGVTDSIWKTGGPVRIEAYTELAGEVAQTMAAAGLQSAIGAPIVVDTRTWGAIAAISTSPEPLAQGAEDRLAGFTRLMGTAIANAESRAQLAGARARVIAAADETRRQIERDLHDGAQQQLVSLALRLRAIGDMIPPGSQKLRAEVELVTNGLTLAFEELREMSQGIHPAILARGGIAPALRMLARRSPLAVELKVRIDRIPESVEVAVYYIVSEALTNAAKHASATDVGVVLETVDAAVRLQVRDNGMGGAHVGRGSGLLGLQDRVEALGGTLSVASPAGGGTTIDVVMPLPSAPTTGEAEAEVSSGASEIAPKSARA
jgi:signal transduction histidine kinase